MSEDFIIHDNQLQLMACKLGYKDLSEMEIADVKVAVIGDIWKRREEIIYPIIKHAVELRLKGGE